MNLTATVMLMVTVILTAMVTATATATETETATLMEMVTATVMEMATATAIVLRWTPWPQGAVMTAFLAFSGMAIDVYRSEMGANVRVLTVTASS